MRTTEIKPAQPSRAEAFERRATFDFDAADVTGTHALRARNVQRSSPAGAVAKALASRMALPQNVPWTLRLDSTGAYLDEEAPIGEQIGADSKVQVVPKAHLG